MYRLSQPEKKEVQRQVEELLNRGVCSLVAVQMAVRSFEKKKSSSCDRRENETHRPRDRKRD